MGALIFFLIGIPLAFAADRLIQRFQRPDEEESSREEDTPGFEQRQLPWQALPWSEHLRRGVVLFLPPLAAVAGWRFEPLEAAAVTLLIGSLLICTATDLLRYKVPNAITYPGTALALLGAFLFATSADLLDAALAAALGGLVFLLMAVVTRGGLGLGDVKLAVLIGAALGLHSAYAALALGVLLGGVVIFVLFVTGRVGRRQAVPYAPFLALAAVVVLLTQGPVFAPV